MSFENIAEFQKKLVYKKYNGNLNCQLFSDNFRLEEFQRLNKFYNDEFDDLFRNISHEKWTTISRFYNPVSYIMKEYKAKFELFGKPWTKIYEILMEFPLVTNSTSKLNSLHLEEQSGSTVCALNHYLKMNHTNVSIFLYT